MVSVGKAGRANNTSTARTFVQDLIILAVGVALTLSGFGVGTLFGVATWGSSIVNRGTAVARTCEYGGPFESGSIGWWWTCQADVTWQDGTHESRTFRNSQLTGDDIGRPVDVVERRISQGKGKGSHLSVYRSSFEPNIFWGVVLMVPLVAGGGLAVLVVLLKWGSTLKSAVSRSRSASR